MMSRNINQQSGAILVIALMLLLVMTLMGVTSMSITTSELKIASNQQAHETSYEAAYAMLHSVRNNTPMSDLGWTNTKAPLAEVNIVESGFEAKAILTYDHCLRANPGNSLTIEDPSGDSSALFGRVVQEIVATGSAMKGATTVLATTTLVNGVSVTVAGCP